MYSVDRAGTIICETGPRGDNKFRSEDTNIPVARRLVDSSVTKVAVTPPGHGALRASRWSDRQKSKTGLFIFIRKALCTLGSQRSCAGNLITSKLVILDTGHPGSPNRRCAVAALNSSNSRDSIVIASQAVELIVTVMSVRVPLRQRYCSIVDPGLLARSSVFR